MIRPHRIASDAISRHSRTIGDSRMIAATEREGDPDAGMPRLCETE